MDRTLSLLSVFGLFLTVVIAGAAYFPGSSFPIAPGTAPIHVVDLNADDALDVLRTTDNGSKILWHRNDDGSFSESTTIVGQAGGIQSLFASDLTGDGSPDVLSTSLYTDEVAWYENTDGHGTFSEKNVIDPDAARPVSAVAAKLDSDDDADVLVASSGDGKVVWYENTNGEGSFSDENVISTAVAGARAVYAADLDGDGDRDVLTASSSYGGSNKIAWYRNTAGGFASQNVISQKLSGARSVFAADLDGDGHQDVLSASKNDGKIAWYENTSGYGTFSQQKVISTSAPGARAVYAADLDGDGDQDVLAASERLVWYENTDGEGTFSNQKVISTSGPFSSVLADDVDGDGNPDVLSVSVEGNQVVWYGNDVEKGEGFSNAQPIGSVAAN
jgi:hypothetical protein